MVEDLDLEGLHAALEALSVVLDGREPTLDGREPSLGHDPTNARLSTLVAWFSGNEKEWNPSAEWFTRWSRQRIDADRAGWEGNHGVVQGTDMYVQ